MIDALSGPRTAVENHTEAILSDPLFPRQLGGHIDHITHKLLISRFQIEERLYVFTRDNQDVNRSLWVDVPEGHDRLVLVDDVPLDVSLDNATKKTFAHFVSPPGIIRRSIFT